MAKETTKFDQRTFIVGKVGKVDIKDVAGVKDKSKTYTRVDVSLLTPEGVFVNVSKMAEQKEGTSEWIVDKIEEAKALKVRIENKEEIYAQVSTKKSKDGILFDKFSTFINDEGKMSIKLDGYVAEVPFDKTTAEDGTETVNIHFKEKTVPFTEITSNISVTMIVESKEDNKVFLTSEGDYPVSVVAQLPDAIYESAGNMADVGQGYTIKLALKKGAKLEGKASGEMSWDNEKSLKTEYASNYLEILNVQKVKDYRSEYDTSESQNAFY